MESIIYRDDTFLISSVEIFDESEDSVALFFELIELPNKKLGLFDSYSDAERAMKSKIWSMDEL